MLEQFVKKFCGVSDLPDVLATDPLIYEVVWTAWQGGFKVSSNKARNNSLSVGTAASLGLITTKSDEGQYGRTWYVTAEGLAFMTRYTHKTRPAVCL